MCVRARVGIAARRTWPPARKQNPQAYAKVALGFESGLLQGAGGAGGRAGQRLAGLFLIPQASVSSLCRFAGYHAPGLLRLRRGTLAHRGLARGSSSVQCARHARVCTHSRPRSTPYSGVTVLEPDGSPPAPLGPRSGGREDGGRRHTEMLPQRVCCSWPGAMPVQHARVSEQAQEHTSPNKN